MNAACRCNMLSQLTKALINKKFTCNLIIYKKKQLCLAKNL